MNKILTIISQNKNEIGIYPSFNENFNSLELEEINKNSEFGSKLSEELINELTIIFKKKYNLDENLLKDIIRRVTVSLNHLVCDRYFRINKILSKKNKFKYYKYSYKKKFQLIEDLESQFRDENFNKYILSFIIENYYPSRTFPLKNQRKNKNINKLSNKNINTMHHVFSNRVFSKFFKLIEICFSLFVKKKICSFNLAHFNESFSRRLFFIKFIKFVNYKNLIKDSHFNQKIRKDLFSNLIENYKMKIKNNSSHENKVKFLTLNLLFKFFPTCFLEGLSDNCYKYSIFLKNNKYKYLILDGDSSSHETYLYSILRHVNKLKVIRFNHGGGAGYIKDNRYSMEMVYKRCDIFISWGLNKFPTLPKNIPIHYLPNPWLSEKKFYYAKKNNKAKPIDILYFPQKIKSISGMLEGASTFTTDIHKEYFNQILDIINLAKKNSLFLKIKPYSYECYKILKNYLYQNNIEINCLYNAKTKSLTQKQFNESKCVLFDYPGTGFLECLTSNIPVYVIWNKKFCNVYRNYKVLFKKLNDVKISFDNPKKLINFIIDNKLKKKTIPKKSNLIINSFINHTCRIDRNWYIHWSKFFNSLS